MLSQEPQGMSLESGWRGSPKLYSFNQTRQRAVVFLYGLNRTQAELHIVAQIRRFFPHPLKLSAMTLSSVLVGTKTITQAKEERKKVNWQALDKWQAVIDWWTLIDSIQLKKSEYFQIQRRPFSLTFPADTQQSSSWTAHGKRRSSGLSVFGHPVAFLRLLEPNKHLL